MSAFRTPSPPLSNVCLTFALASSSCAGVSTGTFHFTCDTQNRWTSKKTVNAPSTDPLITSSSVHFSHYYHTIPGPDVQFLTFSMSYMVPQCLEASYSPAPTSRAERQGDLPTRFAGIVLLRSQIRHAIHGRCAKVSVSASGFREQLQRRDLLPESAASGGPSSLYTPPLNGPHAGCHSSRHSVGPLPWCCLSRLTGGL